MSAICLSEPNVEPKAPEPIGRPSGRRAMVDVARLAAVYAVTWLHTPRSPGLEPSLALGRVAVPFFIFAAVFFVLEGLRRHPERTFVQYTRSRFLRIYVPFLAWSGIYLVLKLIKAILLPEQPNDLPGVSMLWAGSFYHLWFMPFILIVSLVVFVIGKAVAGRPALESAVAVLVAVAGIALTAMPTSAMPSTAGQNGRVMERALPTVCWAILFALAWRRPAARYLEHRAATACGLLLLAGSIAWMWCASVDRLAEGLAGLGLMIVALAPTTNIRLARLGKLGTLAYGIYLSHLLFIKVFEALGTEFNVAVTWQLDVSIFILSAAGSTLLAWSLSKWRPTQWMAA